MDGSTMDEHRHSPRRRALLSAKAVYPGGAISIDCTIVDRSEGGARIRAARNALLPNRFFLLDLKHATAHDVTIAWTAPPYWGLKFGRSFALNRDLPADLKYLAALWIEHAAR